MGFIKNLWDTIKYISDHGWVEYRKARRRYDRHQDAVYNKEHRYTKAGEIALVKDTMKRIRR